MAVIVDEEKNRAQALRLLAILGVRLPPSTKLPQTELDARVSKALDCSQRQAGIFGDKRKIDPKALKKWDPSLFNLVSSMFSATYEERITGDVDGTPLTALRTILSESMAAAYLAMGETRFFAEDGKMDRSIRLKLKSVHIAAEDIPMFAIEYAPGTVADDDEEGIKMLVNPDTYTLLLRLLDLNAARTDSANSGDIEPGWKSSYLLPLGHISMKDIGSLTRSSGCIVCGQKGSNVCSGCKLVSYCCKDCQRADWANHKAMCLSLETGTWFDFKTSKDLQFKTLINRKDRPGEVRQGKQSSSKTYGNEPFLIKIQANGPDAQHALVYDRKRVIQETLLRYDNPDIFQRLVDAVQKGYLGLKTYLWAKQVAPRTLSICLDRKAKQSEIDW